MKESVHDIRGTESSDDRKRRLARERQRRHREKIRARIRAETESNNQQNVIVTAARASSHFQDARKRNDDEPVVPAERDQIQRKAFSQREAYVDPPDLHSAIDVRNTTTNLTPKASHRAVKPSSIHAQKPVAERSTAALRRSERSFAAKPSLRGEKHDREDKRQTVTNQRHTSAPQKPQDKQQQIHHQHQRRQHPTQRQQHHDPDNLQQQQRQPQERTPDIRHRSADVDQTSQAPLLDQQRDHQTREQQQSELEKKDQREPLQRPPQRHEYGRHDVLQQQTPPFQSNSHGYSATTHQQHVSQPHHQHETGFGFPQTEAAVGQPAYVTDPHRQYMHDSGMQLGVTARTYPRFGMPTRSSMANTAPGFTTVQGAGQGLHNNITTGAQATVNVGVPAGLSLNRDAGVTKFRHAANNSVAGVQHASSQLSDGRDAGGTVDPYAHNSAETPEERKRRLARDRQRRRRKRLKHDASEQAKATETLQRSQHEVARDPMAGHAGVATAALDIPMHVRGAEPNMQPQSSGAMHAALPTFESPTLASSHPLTAGVHALQVSGVTGGQDDLGGAASARGGFSTHTLGVAGASSATAAASGVLAHPGVGELHRMHSHSEDKLSRAQYPDEDPEARKRRLARERQRRRRERLKSRKLGVGDLSGGNVHELKSTGAGSSTKLPDGVDPRTASDSEKRVVASEGIGEADRIQLGAGSTVFGTRADVAQSLTFGDQTRNMRAPIADGTVSGMPISLAASNMLNLPNVHVNNIGLQSQHLVHWSQAFESEGSAKFAVENAVAAFRAQLSNASPAARSYIIQQGVIILLGAEDGGRDLVNGPMIPSLRTDTVMRL